MGLSEELHLLKFLQELGVGLSFPLFDGVGRLIRDMRVTEHDRGWSIAFPAHFIDQAFLLFAGLFVDCGRQDRSWVGFEAGVGLVSSRFQVRGMSTRTCRVARWSGD